MIERITNVKIKIIKIAYYDNFLWQFSCAKDATIFENWT